MLHVPPAPLDFEELLAAERNVLRGQVRVGASQQVVAVEVLLGLDLRGVDAELAGRGRAEVAVRPGLSAILPRSSPRLKSLSLSVSSIRVVSWETSCLRRCWSRVAASGLWQITNRSVPEIRTSWTRMFWAISP